MVVIRLGTDITNFQKIVLSHSTESFHRQTLLCFRSYLISKNFMDERGDEEEEGGCITFFVQKILSHSAENFRWGIL